MGSRLVPAAVPLPGITNCLVGGSMINCSTSSNFTSLQCYSSTPFQSLISGGSGKLLAAPQPLESSTQGDAASEKPLFEFQRQWGNPESTSVKDGVYSSTHPSISTEKLEKESKGQESGNKASRSLRSVIRLPPKRKKYSEEFKDEEEKFQDNQTGALGAEELEKETKGFELGKKEGDRETRSSRKTFIRLPSKKKKVSEEIRDQEEQKVKNYAFQEDGKPLSGLNDHEKEPLPKIEEKQKKRGFTMALPREQIEEDIIALIGSKPSSRAKKRSRTAKKHFNNLFPGAWLESIAAADD